MISWIFWLSILVILYVYLGFPLILGLLARFHPVIADYPSFTPFITLLIAAYNEEKVIAKKLENSLNLAYPSGLLQIVVAADGSDDQTVEIVRKYQKYGVELSYAAERRGKISAINRAMKLVKGQIIVFSDANNIYDRDALKHLAAPFSDVSVGAVIGAKLIHKGESSLGESEGAYWRYESWIKEQETRLGHCTGSVGEIFAIRREVFEPPPEKIINDDFYLLMQIIRKGWKTIYTPKAKSTEQISANARDEIIRRTRINAGRYQAIGLAFQILPWQKPLVVWQVISHKFLRPLLPVFMILAYLSNLLVLVWPAQASHFRLWNLNSPFNWLFFAAQTMFYLTAWLGSQLKGRGKLANLLYIPTFLVNSNFAALMGLIRYLSRQQTQIWKRVQR